MTNALDSTHFKELVADYWKSEANSGRIYLWDELTSDLGMSIIHRLERMESDSNVNDITLIINSCGGNGGQMFAISDYLRMMKTKVVTVGMGVVFSAAVPILASGNVRKAFRNTDFMFHGSSFSSPNSMTSLDSAISAEYRVKFDSKLYMAMADLTKKPKSFWRNMIDSHCHYFSAAEALEWGVIDEIL